jgi:uncharacterized protein (TIGR01777 family)
MISRQGRKLHGQQITATFVELQMKTILITGGTGFIGKVLTTELLSAGYRVILVTRQNRTASGNPALQYAQWDIARQTIDDAAIRAADAIIHLAGAGVADKRWTAAYKKEILDSRIQSTALLATALRETPHHVRTLLSASAIGWYGQDRPDRSPFTESDPPAMDFLGDTCRQWEQAADAIAEQGIRTCKLRTGIVLGLGGGALKEYDLPLKLGIAPILGPGNQMLSWIHIRDLCRMYIFLLEQEQMSGVFNATAPNPVSNETFGRTLAQTRNKNRFIALPVPAFVLKLVKGESSIEVLKSTTVSAHKIKTAGFVFQFPTVQRALENIYSTL